MDKSSTRTVAENRINALPAFVADFDLKQQIRMLWRRRVMIFAVTGVVLLGSWLVIGLMTPIYSASSRVMIDTRKTRYVDIKEVMSSMTPQLTTVLSEVEVLRSRDLAERVANTLNLYADPEFNPALRPKPEGIRAIPGMITGLFSAKKPVDEEERIRRERSAVVAAVLARMSASPVPQSMVINISFNSPNPATAAKLANSIAEAYVFDQLEAKFEATRRASVWLNQRVEGLRQSLQESERAVSAYRAESGLLDSRGGLQPSHQQLMELNSQIIQTQAKRSELEAKVARIDTMMRADGGGAIDDNTDSPLIQRLRESEATLLREISDMSTRYGEMHPKMIKSKAELVELREKIRVESSKLGGAVRNELGVVRAREAALREQVRKIEGTLATQGRAEVRLRELEREAQANRMMYENFLGRFKETTEQEQIQQPDARVISRAERPLSPSYPRTGLLMAAATLVGLVLGAMLAILMEKFDDTFRAQDELEEITRLPSIGMIPLIGKRKLKGGLTVPGYLVGRPASSFAEAFRSLWVTLSHGGLQGPPRVLAVTSALPGEGKSLTALSLARTVANLGGRVVLVDCDLRRSSVARMLDLQPAAHMDELLEGRASIDQAIVKDNATSLSIIAAHSMERPMLDLLNSQAMANLVAELRSRFDLVVLDSPPVMPVSETQVISRMADTTLFCVRWDSTQRDIVKSALRILKDIQVNLAGTVLTQVNVERHARYGYGDMGHYYGRYSAYYKD